MHKLRRAIILRAKSSQFLQHHFTAQHFLQHHAAKVALPSSARFDSANLHNAHLAMRQILCILFGGSRSKIADQFHSASFPELCQSPWLYSLFYTLTNTFARIHIYICTYTSIARYMNMYKKISCTLYLE